MDYQQFIESKQHTGTNSGFKPLFMPDCLFDFQKYLAEWALIKGRSATFADCGLGKTLLQLVFAENIVRKTNRPFLILTPLAVSGQTVREAAKFGMEAHKCQDGKLNCCKIVVTNYERLHYFNPNDFAGACCDESGILKNFDGKTKAAVTDFMRKLPYRSLYTATAAPNDYIELGTSSEALGELGYMDMLARFFKNNQNSLHPSLYRHRGQNFALLNEGAKWRFRGHAERDFWRWVCSWARTLRKPSDVGFDDAAFILPPLETKEYVVKARTKNAEYLFDMPAVSLDEQRDERRRTITERCELAAELVSKNKGASVSWCHLNDEGDLLEKLIPNCVQVSGDDADEKKEEAFEAFQTGKIKNMVTKSKIGGFGLNWQHCAHQTFFPSHSFEQWYQSIRRSWRFGQKKTVHVDIITSEGESRVISNLRRKAQAAEVMFARLVELMNNELKIAKINPFTVKEKKPSWL